MDKQEMLERAIKESQKDPNFMREMDRFVKESLRVRRINH